MSDTRTFRSAEQGYKPDADDPGGAKPVIVMDVPFSHETKNYRAFKVDFDREVITTNVSAYLTPSDLHHLGSPRRVRVTVEALD